jgi:hypothetical protein
VTSVDVPPTSSASSRPAREAGPQPADDEAPLSPDDEALDAALEGDPDGTYARLDAPTRRRYRLACLQLAAWAGGAPLDAARLALHAARAQPAPARGRHVGYHLLAEGRPRLEQRLGARVPPAERAARCARRHAQALYLAALATLASLAWVAALWLLVSLGATTGLCLAAAILFVVPALNLAAALVDTAILVFSDPPAPLPRLDPAHLDARASAFVVLPVLLHSPDELDAQLDVLERNFLNAPLPSLRFALLTDFADAPCPRLPSDPPLLDALARGIARLNRRHAPLGPPRFFFFHRDRRPCPAEGAFLGWERKRGKLAEFNRRLAGAADTSFVASNAPPGSLGPVRYVVTLDADNLLPPGALARLLATFEHPLHRPRLGPDGRVLAGYGVLQPRIEFSPRPAQSLLRSIFLGPALVRLQTLTDTIPSAHQDLFGTGQFLGKGVYDVEAFAGLEGRFPEGRVLSHDRLEGMFARTGYVSDAVVFEDHPFDIVSWLRRWHRWARGDWQALAWALPRVPTGRGRPERTTLRPIDRWSLVAVVLDQLHSSATLALLVAGWFALPQGLVRWTLALALVSQHRSIVPPLGPVLRALRRRASAPSLVNAAKKAAGNVLGGAVLGTVFMAPHAFVISDAIARASYRLAVSRKHLLQWTAQAVVERQGRGSLAVLDALKAGPGLAAASALALAAFAPRSLAPASPLLLLWALGPLAALAAGAITVPPPLALTADDRQRLRALARRAWALYERLAPPDLAPLPPADVPADASPPAPHTSPTDLAFALLAALAAHDLGYLATADLAARLEPTLRALARLERHRGLFLARYALRQTDEGSRQADELPRHPDDAPPARPAARRRLAAEPSGWLAAALYVLDAGLRAARAAPQPAAALLEGLADTAAVLRDVLAEARGAADEARGAPRGAADDGLVGGLRRLHAELDALAAAPDLAASDLARAAALVTRALDALEDDWLAWRELDDQPASPAAFWWQRLRAQAALVAREADRARHDDGEARAALDRAAALARRLRDGLSFAPLYDARRGLLRTGVDLDADAEAPEPACHEQLADAARLASFVAIARDDVPARHWITLGRDALRPDVQGRQRTRATLTDYVMPTLLLRTPALSRLGLSAADALDAQAANSARRAPPRGADDPDGGAPPALAPHLALAALRLRPALALASLRALARPGALGPYGPLASAPARPGGRDRGPARYRPALQGAALVAVVNALRDDLMVRRFHADPALARLDFLLYEATPEP